MKSDLVNGKIVEEPNLNKDNNDHISHENERTLDEKQFDNQNSKFISFNNLPLNSKDIYPNSLDNNKRYLNFFNLFINKKELNQFQASTIRNLILE